MKNFENIKSQWQSQPDIKVTDSSVEKITNRVKQLKQQQQITNVVLGITCLLLIAFFFYVKAYLETRATIAISLMTSVLILRIAIEFFSIKKLKTIKLYLDVSTFKNKLINYYKTRIKTHYILTPIILLMYVLGFLMLMPYFKTNLSKGFYLYIQISGVVVLIVGTIFIAKQIQKELRAIKNLIK